MFCVFDYANGGKVRCRVCRQSMTVPAGIDPDTLKAVCVPQKPMGLGGWTEKLLATLGIRKERYLAAKSLFGFAPTCDCDKRKEWLNKVSDWWRGEGQTPSSHADATEVPTTVDTK